MKGEHEVKDKDKKWKKFQEKEYGNSGFTGSGEEIEMSMKCKKETPKPQRVRKKQRCPEKKRRRTPSSQRPREPQKRGGSKETRGNKSKGRQKRSRRDNKKGV